MNAKKSAAKRYIVTYRDPQTTLAAASSILGIENVQDGISIMATDADVNDSDILHFEGVGVTSLILSDESAEALKNNEQVMAVEEDIEVRALIDSHTNGEAVTTFEPSDIALEYYNIGYSKGVVDTRRKLAEGFRRLIESQNGERLAVSGRPAHSVEVDQALPWNIALIQAGQAWSRGITGDGVKVAVIDTGIAEHVDLVIRGGVSMVPGVSSYHDDNGHGTHCAGIIAAKNSPRGTGIAPKALLYAVKVLNQMGSGSLSWVLAGMEWALQNNMKVISMSLGSPSAPSIAYSNAINRLTEAGITVVCAAGNYYSSNFPWVNSPANCHSSAIAVGAIDSSRLIASFSSRGVNGTDWNSVTIAAPGVSVKSTWPVPANSYKPLSGTSMACPHVSGAVALVCQKFPNLTPSQIKARLIHTASDLGVPGLDMAYGAGLVDCDMLTQ